MIFLLDGNKVSSRGTDLSVSSAGTGGRCLSLGSAGTQRNPSGRRGPNHPKKPVKSRARLHPSFAARRTVLPSTARNRGAEDKSVAGSFVLVRPATCVAPPHEATKGDQSIPRLFSQSPLVGTSSHTKSQKHRKKRRSRPIQVAKAILFPHSFLLQTQSFFLSFCGTQSLALPACLACPVLSFFLFGARCTEGVFSLFFLFASLCVCVLGGVILA